MRTMPAGEFKAKCLAVMDEVQATGQPVIVTKRGKPVARLTPIQLAAKQSPESSNATNGFPAAQGERRLAGKEPLFGRLRHMAVITGDLVSSEFENEEWDRMFDEKWARFEKDSAS